MRSSICTAQNEINRPDKELAHCFLIVYKLSTVKESLVQITLLLVLHLHPRNKILEVKIFEVS